MCFLFTLYTFCVHFQERSGRDREKDSRGERDTGERHGVCRSLQSPDLPIKSQLKGDTEPEISVNLHWPAYPNSEELLKFKFIIVLPEGEFASICFLLTAFIDLQCDTSLAPGHGKGIGSYLLSKEIQCVQIAVVFFKNKCQ